MSARIVHVWRSRRPDEAITRCGLDAGLWRWRNIIGRVVYKRGPTPANRRRKHHSRWCRRCVRPKGEKK